ncbi:MAG: hypothetical protein R3D66_02370 [Alphaproteobacteria bacterium]
MVGPNGCGKSNLVKLCAGSWAESSAKRMRGGADEDVIFNGTSKRSARLTEIALLLDNSARESACRL